MQAVVNYDGTLLAMLIICVIFLIVSVRLGLFARLLSVFRSRPGLPGAELNAPNADLGISTTDNSSIREGVKTDNTIDYQQFNLLTPTQMTPVDKVSILGSHKVNINADVAGDDSGDTCRSDQSTSIRAEKTGGVYIAGGTIIIGGDIVAGDKMITMDLTKSVPITCPACGRGYVPADSQYACPNCATATPKNLVQSS